MIDRGFTELEQQAFYDSVLEAAFAAHEAMGPAEDVMVTAAGLPIRMSFAGPAMRQILVPALQHIITDASAVATATLHI